MKRLIVNRKITVLTFAVMFLIYGITSLGFAHETEDQGPHFQDDSTTRTVASDASLGANVGDPVSAHNFGDLSPGDGSPNQPILVGPGDQIQQPDRVELHYALSSDNSDFWYFRVAKTTGQITVGRPLDPGTYSVRVSIDRVTTTFDKDGNRKVKRTMLDSIDVTITAYDPDAEAAPQRRMRWRV